MAAESDAATRETEISAEAGQANASDHPVPTEPIQTAVDTDNKKRVETESHSTLEKKIQDLEKQTQKKEIRLNETAKTRKKASKLDNQEVLRIICDSKSTAEEKATSICSLGNQQTQEIKALNKDVLIAQRKLDQVISEKNAVVAESSRSQAVRGKLETLCRELQKQNKLIQEESQKAAVEEQAKRQELSSRFQALPSLPSLASLFSFSLRAAQDTVTEINSRLEAQGEERAKHVQENDDLREKLLDFVQKLETREQQHGHELKAKDLEKQLAEKQLEQAQCLNQEALLKAETYKEQTMVLAATEQELRGQLSAYKEKFEQFQEMLTKSHEVFTTFKADMDKMSKTIKKLEKDNQALRSKSEKSDVSMIELLDEREQLKKKSEVLQGQKAKLEGLCRSLQAERLKARNSEPSDAPQPASDPTAVAAASPSDAAPTVDNPNKEKEQSS
ncbi:hypothetical protein CYMTET_51055 [Cymbomonas tetramitiformis]|uniref:Alpha-taxilin n=1 Tax=Cymbomonas tetramitiformis TaxID=36881 RepID=A0AAE0ET15_9CHLO|nr:hypothetical protein CYMTET_51055 [Cymbomonas tetramitiformis]